MRVLLLVVLLHSTIQVFGQSTVKKHTYVRTDTSTSIGVNVISRPGVSNYRTCAIKAGEGLIHYYPDQITEYKISRKKVFLSSDIVYPKFEKQVFFERLVEGENSLYFLKENEENYFFIKKISGEFSRISRKTFKSNLISTMSDCEFISSYKGVLSFNRRSMSELVNRYNSCDGAKLPFHRFGVLFGKINNDFITNNVGSEVEVPRNRGDDMVFINTQESSTTGLSFGLFYELHIDKKSNLSLLSELKFNSFEFESIDVIEGKMINLKVNSLNLPLLLRYSFPLNKIRPFVNTGLMLTYNLGMDNRYDGLEVSSGLYPAQHWAGVAGIGLAYDLIDKKSISAEIRAVNFLNGFNKNIYGRKSIEFLIGFGF